MRSLAGEAVQAAVVLAMLAGQITQIQQHFVFSEEQFVLVFCEGKNKVPDLNACNYFKCNTFWRNFSFDFENSVLVETHFNYVARCVYVHLIYKGLDAVLFTLTI